MGFLLTILYIALSLLSPKDLMPSLGEYRVELLVALLAVIVSAPKLLDGEFFRTPQIYLLVGLLAAVFLSVAIGVHWLGGGFFALQKFLTTSIVFFLVVLNCGSLRKLRATVVVVTLIAIFFVLQGARTYYAAESNIHNVCKPTYDEQVPATRLVKVDGVLEICDPMLDVIPLSEGNFAFRMRGLGVLKDPNDFAQFLVMLVPLIWVAWRGGRFVRNLLLVLVPTVLLVWGLYLTHSRGGIIALVVIVMLALSSRTNLVAAALAGVLAFGAMTALNFSGGREISLQAGSNRFMLWGDGLALFKSAPVFGVGYENFANANRGQTAHNSFVVCLAELGLFGYGFWVALLVFAFAGLNALTRGFKVFGNGPPGTPAQSGLASDQSDLEIKKWAVAIRLSLAGFLAAAFFLSRAYAITLYLALGMAVALSSLASKGNAPFTTPPLWKRLGLSAGVGVASILLVYCMIRVANALALDKSGIL